MEEAYHIIFDEIVNNAVEKLCFEVHRAVKLNYFSVDEFILKENQFEVCASSSDTSQSEAQKGELIYSEESIFKSTKKSHQITCPCCSQKKVEVTSLMRHLNSCMKNTRRQSGRNASKRINMDANRIDDFFDDYDNFSDGSSSSKRTRKKVGKNSRAAKLKAKAVVDVAEPSSDIIVVENSEKTKEKPPAVSKRTKKAANSGLKYVQPNEEEKKQNKLSLLQNRNTLELDEVDVDTVESIFSVWQTENPPIPSTSTQSLRQDGMNFNIHF